MKLLAPLFFLFALNAFGESNPLRVGCLKRVWFCDPTTKKCGWAAKQGQVFSIELKKFGDGPSYEIWEGRADLNLQDQPFVLSLYQRREESQSVDYLTIDLPVNGVMISNTGRELVQVLYLDEGKVSGVGIRCTTAVGPVP